MMRGSSEGRGSGLSGVARTDRVACSRGNLTRMATQVSGTVTLYRKLTYYDTGNVDTATDAGTTTSGGLTGPSVVAPLCQQHERAAPSSIGTYSFFDP